MANGINASYFPFWGYLNYAIPIFFGGIEITTATHLDMVGTIPTELIIVKKILYAGKLVEIFMVQIDRVTEMGVAGCNNSLGIGGDSC